MSVKIKEITFELDKKNASGKTKFHLNITKANPISGIRSIKTNLLGDVMTNNELTLKRVNGEYVPCISGVSIAAWKWNDGQKFSSLSKGTIRQICRKWKKTSNFAKNFGFALTIDGNGYSQEYRFNRYQMEKLVPMLQKSLAQEWTYKDKKK